jgi:hypothetical protein
MLTGSATCPSRSGAASTRHGAAFDVVCASLFFALAVLLTGCGERPPKEPTITPAVSPDAKSHFLHQMIARRAPGGVDCCSDVAAVGDINGDGFPDVIIGGERARSDALAWFEYPTWKRHNIARGEFTTDGVAVDFNGDGRTDIVIGDLQEGIVWFEQERSQGRWIRHRIAPGYAHDLAVADVDGDGRLDVVRADKRKLEIWYQVAPGRFEGELVLESKGEGLAVADIDGDGKLDIVFSNLWLEQQGRGSQRKWVPHAIAPKWTIDTRVRVVDMNGDGRADIVVSGSEGRSPLSWFEAPPDPRSSPWREHPIEREELVGAHSLNVADFDLDGRPDVVVAEMHTSPLRRIILYRNLASGWQRTVLATHGSHNMVMADFDGDADMDLVGKNYAGRERFIEYWENRAADLKRVPRAPAAGDVQRRWDYITVDAERPAYDRHTFGLYATDMDGDGREDILAGGTLYRERGNDARGGSSTWERVAVAPGHDVLHVLPNRRNGWRIVLFTNDRYLKLAWVGDAGRRDWQLATVRQLPEGRIQGVAAGPLRPDGSYELYFTRGQRLFKLRISADPKVSDPWPLTLIDDQVEEAGIALGDIGGTGNLDIVAVDRSGRRIVWLEPMANGYRRHLLGSSLTWIDRVAITDINGDGRPDVIFTEERGDSEYAARAAWLEAPASPASGRWRAHTIAVLRSLNSLSLNDTDGDGRADVVLAEHTDLRPGKVAADNLTAVLLNRGGGAWEMEVIDVAPHSSHMGVQPIRVGDRPGLVSIGWEQPFVHLWLRRTETAARGTGTIGR